MANAADVADALLGRCTSLSVGSPPLEVAYPEVAFVPPADPFGEPLAYLEARIFLNGHLWTGLAGGKVSEGMLQLMLVAPPREGVIKALTLADAVAAHFPAGLRVPPCKLQEPFIGSPISDDDKLLITIRIPWTA